jgi:hypothetical protein
VRMQSLQSLKHLLSKSRRRLLAPGPRNQVELLGLRERERERERVEGDHGGSESEEGWAHSVRCRGELEAAAPRWPTSTE